MACYADLGEFIDKNQCQCLNEMKDHDVSSLFDGNPVTYLQSDPSTDSQLLITIGFRLPVKVASIKFEMPAGAQETENPDTIKIWNKKDDSLDCASAEETAALEEWVVVPGEEFPVRLAKFSNVHHLQIFVQGSRGAANDDPDVSTKIGRITITGQPAQAMDMKDWKPIKG